MFVSSRTNTATGADSAPYLFTVEQCIEENIPLSPGYRDFEGYKGKYPDPKWPGDAKLCVNIVLNYEEGGEYSLLNGDLRTEKELQEMGGREARIGVRDIPIESQYEYGTRVGVWRVGRLFEEKNIKATVYAVGQSILKSPDAAKYLVQSGHEISSHGYRWIDHHSMPLAVEKQQIEQNIAAIESISGKAPRGWYVGRPSMSSKPLVCHVYKEQDLELLYQCDSYADEMPYWTPHPTESGKGLLIIPYTYDVNDNKFCTNPGFANPKDWLDYCKSSFDVMYEEGCKARFKALRELIDYIRGHDGVWFATREEIARHWMKTHPFDKSKLNRIPHFI